MRMEGRSIMIQPPIHTALVVIHEPLFVATTHWGLLGKTAAAELDKIVMLWATRKNHRGLPADTIASYIRSGKSLICKEPPVREENFDPDQVQIARALSVVDNLNKAVLTRVSMADGRLDSNIYYTWSLLSGDTFSLTRPTVEYFRHLGGFFLEIGEDGAWVQNSRGMTFGVVLPVAD